MIGKWIDSISNWFFNVIGSLFSNPSKFFHNFFHGLVHSIQEILIWGSIIIVFIIVFFGLAFAILEWARNYFKKNNNKWETDFINNNKIFNLKYKRLCIKGETNAWNNYSKIN